MARDGGWTRAFFELWLGLTRVTDVSVRVVARTDGFWKIVILGISRRVW